MGDWWYERWKEGDKWMPVFMPAKRGDGAHDDMFFASALAQKCFMDQMPWWKRLWLRTKIFFKERSVKSFFRIIVFIAVFVAATAIAQQPPAPQPQPTKVTPKSPYDVRDAKIAVITEDDLQKTANALTADYQRQMADLQAKWKEQDVALKAWEAEVRKANGWNDDYVFNQQTYEWAKQPKPAETKPAEAPKK